MFVFEVKLGMQCTCNSSVYVSLQGSSRAVRERLRPFNPSEMCGPQYTMLSKGDKLVPGEGPGHV